MMNRLVGVALLSWASAAAAGVAGSKHDFSSRGPGPYRALEESSPCIFCHISHWAGPTALSNRPDTSANHQPYESSTMTTAPGAPTGSSRKCLSCHDGTIAVGQTRARKIRMEKGEEPLEPGHRANVGTDLRRTHPVSMNGHQSGKKLRKPGAGDGVALDRGGMVQCTSCHDPHDEWRDPDVGKFLVKPSARSAICTSCHTFAATSATHLSSPAPWTSPTDGKTRTIAEAGCGICHVPHGADTRGRLLRNGVADEDVCLRCHGSSTRVLVSTDLAKSSAHAPSGRGRHDAGEGPNAPDARRLPETSPGAPRHVTCVDCHDPHSSSAALAVAGAPAGALAGVWGIDLEGERVERARFEYEICLKCHGDSANKAAGRDDGGLDRVRRAQREPNLRLAFAATAVSFHPVAARGRSAVVPGLLPPYTAASTIQCTDCHASDTGPAAGGTGARGPHGSIYPYLLERQYLTSDFTPESAASYALCYKCHDRDTLLSDASGFRLHREHVLEQSAPCSACHDAHGISREAGNERNNAHLVSFDLSIVRPGRSGQARYDSLGPGTGNCTLTCHDVPHGVGSQAFAY